MFTMAEQKDGKNPAISEVRVAETINPQGLPTQVLILWRKIHFPSHFSPKHSNSYRQGPCLHIFLLHPGPNNCRWVR